MPRWPPLGHDDVATKREDIEMPDYPEFKDLSKLITRNAKYKAARVARQSCPVCLTEVGHSPNCGRK